MGDSLDGRSEDGYLRKRLFMQVATLRKEGYDCKKAMHAKLIRGPSMQEGTCLAIEGQSLN